MPNPLFSTYTHGENRVTATLVAVLEHVNTRLSETCSRRLSTSQIFRSCRSRTSWSATGQSLTPRSEVRPWIWFETKTQTDSVDLDQVRSHLEGLDLEGNDTQQLVVLTPDHERPPKLERVDDDRVVWMNFDRIVDAVESILARYHGSTEQSFEIPTEREAFLLRELVRFLYEEDLVSGQDDRVLVNIDRTHPS